MRRINQSRMLFLICILLANPAFAEVASESAFVGMYTQRDVESQAQLFILDDKTFCFTFTGGSLDLVKAGRWVEGAADGSIHLKETQIEQPLYPVVVRNIDRLGPKMVGFNFDGYLLSEAYSPVFALSNAEALPTSFRPLFPRTVDSWAGTYALPLLSPDQAIYFFIGDVKVDTSGRPGKKLRIAQYKLEDVDAVRIGFNKLQSDPPYQFKAQLDGNVLYLDRDKFGKKELIPPEMISAVRAQCVAPILQHQPSAATAEQSEKQLRKEARLLTPIKTFELDAKLIAGEPLFKEKTNAVTTPTDDLETLIDAEKDLLKATFKSAFEDAKKVDAYLQLTKSLAEKKGRIKIYMPLLGEQFSQILVKANSDGDFNLARKIFNVFVENIHPAATGVKNRNLTYNISVVASQGFILYGVQKDPALPKIIFGKLLEKDFDIKTHKNQTLVYNLACYYALTNNKEDLLAAAEQARLRGTPKAQFMQDKDFSNYWQDADFLRVLK